MDFGLAQAIHKLQDAAPALRVFFSICLVIVFWARSVRFLQTTPILWQDPHITTDIPAVRNLRLWQVLLVWLLAMELLIEMIVRV